MRRFVSTVLVTGCLAAASTACTIDVRGESVVTREEKRFTVTGRPELTLRTFDGSIEVRSWDRKEVRVEIARRGADAQTAGALVVNAQQNGDRILVEAPAPPRLQDGLRFGWSARSVSFIVTAPREVTLDARTGDGSIATEALTGSLTLNTGDGSIRIRDVNGSVKARTGDGSIRIDEAAGSVEADTGDGSIDLTGRLDGVVVKSGDGSIRVRAEDGSAVATDWSITTGDGAVDLRLPALDAELDAHAGDGSIRADGVAAANRDRHNLRGRLGNGGRMVRVRSGDGSIVITK